MRMYLENMKTLIQKDTFTLIFIAALLQYLTHGNNLNVHNRQLTWEKWFYTHTIEYYPAKKKELFPFTAMWMNLKNILSEINWRKDKYYI